MGEIKQRDYMFDTFRGILMLSIPMSHFTKMSGNLYSELYLGGGFPQATFGGFIYITINVFVMQAFMFLSGYFSKKPERARETAFKTFMWPYLVFTVIYFGVRYFFFGNAHLDFLSPPFALWFLFALFFYRAKVTVTRVILARFSMDLCVNIILNSFVSMWYYAAVLGKSYTFMILPAVIKNLGLFPIESFLLTLFLSVVIPVTRRMKLTYTPVSDGAEAEKRPTGSELKFDKKHLVLLLVLFAIGVSCVVGYLAYYYDHTSLSASYSQQERYDINTRMTDIVREQTGQFQDAELVTTVESAYKKFLGETTTYQVAVYQVDEEKLGAYDKDLETIRGLSKSKAKAVAEDGVMTKIGQATVVLNKDTNQVESFEMN